MAAQSEPDDDILRRYLLRTLPEDERAPLELQALREEAAFEQLQALEDELYHDYAAGRLNEPDRQAFERSLLAQAAGAERLAAARALLARLDATAPRTARPHRAAWLAAAAGLLAASTLWLSRGTVEPPGPQARLVGSPRPDTPDPTAETRPAPSPPPGRVLVLALAAGAVRGEGTLPRARVTSDVSRLRVVLSLPAGSPEARYEVLLRTAEGVTAWSATGLAAEGQGGRTLTLEPPLEGLEEADYEVVLSRSASGRSQALADYRFRLLRD